MIAAFHDSYIEYVLFVGITENYPKWFKKEIEDSIYMDEDRYTFWVPKEDRTPDYYEKTLVEDYSVFLRKPDGEIFVTNYDVFTHLYISFQYDAYTNSGIAAYEEDCVEYVECYPGILFKEYPDWFYEFFTEAVNYPQIDDDETYFFFDENKKLSASKRFIEVDKGEACVRSHCVFLRNKYGEIRAMEYEDFIRYYDANYRRV